MTDDTTDHRGLTPDAAPGRATGDALSDEHRSTHRAMLEVACGAFRRWESGAMVDEDRSTRPDRPVA